MTIDQPKSPTLLPAAEVAKVLSVSRQVVVRMALSGKIPVVKLNSRVLRFDIDAVLTTLKAGSTYE